MKSKNSDNKFMPLATSERKKNDPTLTEFNIYDSSLAENEEPLSNYSKF